MKKFKLISLFLILLNMSLSQETKKISLDIEAWYAPKGTASFTFLGLGLSKDGKKEKFSNSLSLDLQYSDYNYVYGFNSLLYKMIISKKYTLSNKHLFLSFGLGGGGFNYKSLDINQMRVNTAFGFVGTPSVVSGLKFNRVKIGLGLESSFFIGQQKTVTNYYSGKDFLLDFLINIYLKFSYQL